MVDVYRSISEYARRIWAPPASDVLTEATLNSGVPPTSLPKSNVMYGSVEAVDVMHAVAFPPTSPWAFVTVPVPLLLVTDTAVGYT
jgi:hypothetical protein